MDKVLYAKIGHGTFFVMIVSCIIASLCAGYLTFITMNYFATFQEEKKAGIERANKKAEEVENIMKKGLYKASASQLKGSNLIYIVLGVPVMFFVFWYIFVVKALFKSKPTVLKLSCPLSFFFTLIFLGLVLLSAALFASMDAKVGFLSALLSFFPMGLSIAWVIIYAVMFSFVGTHVSDEMF